VSIKASYRHGFRIKSKEMSFNIDINGLQKLQRELEDAARAVGSLDGPIANLSVDPNNPSAAIREMESAVDRKVAPYGGNTLVSQLVRDMKNKFRERILERARTPRT
jgi:hypothetical protein